MRPICSCCEPRVAEIGVGADDLEAQRQGAVLQLVGERLRGLLRERCRRSTGWPSVITAFMRRRRDDGAVQDERELVQRRLQPRTGAVLTSANFVRALGRRT